MAWSDVFWSACNYAVDTGIALTADALHVVGSLACIVGGVAYAVYTGVDESCDASYYALARANSDVSLNFRFGELSFNQTFPLSRTAQFGGHSGYQVSDYLHPETLQTVCIIASVSGTFLRALSANIKLWQQNKADKEFYNAKHGIKISSPTTQSYIYVTAESLCYSMSYLSISNAIAGTVLNSGLLRRIPDVTYPSTSAAESFVNSTYYKGPVKSLMLPIDIEVANDIHISIPVLDLNITIQESAELSGGANITYGGGVSFDANNNPRVNVAAPAVIGAATYLLANRFFSKSLANQRNERIPLESIPAYASIA